MVVSIAPAVTHLGIADDSEKSMITDLLGRLSTVWSANDEAEHFYDGSFAAKDFGISIPPNMHGLVTPTGWGGIVVDVLEERLDWLGWTSDGDLHGLDEVFAQNTLDVDQSPTHLDSLIFGLSFVSVGRGSEDDEPDPLVSNHSAKNMTADWSRRSRRLTVALASHPGKMGEDDEVTLYLPDQTAWFKKRRGVWEAQDRDEHGLGRVPVVAFPNRIRGSRDIGRSEISKPIRYYASAAARTLKGLEVNREFYNAPQRVGLNIDESMFQDEHGKPMGQWSAIMGRMWNVPPNDADEAQPEVKQFEPNSPAPYIDQVNGYATLLAAEAGIPTAYLGLQTDQPASADAIRSLESRLIKRAERRQSVFGRSWQEVARLSLLWRDGGLPDGFDTSISAKWRDAATPTRAAAADEASKLIDAEVLPSDSSVTYDRVGLSEDEQRRVSADKRRSAGASRLTDRLAENAGEDRRAPSDEDEESGEGER